MRWMSFVFIFFIIEGSISNPLVGDFFASGLEALKAALDRDGSELFDKVKAGIDEWVKIGPTVVKENTESVLALLGKFLEPIKKIDPKVDDTKTPNPKGDQDAHALLFRTQILQLVIKLAEQGQVILNKVKANADNGKSIDAETEKKSLLTILDIVFKSATDEFKVIPHDKRLKEMQTSLILVQNIDAEIRKLYPKTTVGRTLYFETEKIVKQIEALLQMYITALKGSVTTVK